MLVGGTWQFSGKASVLIPALGNRAQTCVFIVLLKNCGTFLVDLQVLTVPFENCTEVPVNKDSLDFTFKIYQLL